NDSGQPRKAEGIHARRRPQSVIHRYKEGIHMLKMIVSGCNGHMGQCVVCGCAELEGVEIVAGFNRTPVEKNCFEVYSDPMSYEGPADVVVDFSNPAKPDGLLEFCLLRKIPIVLCTTGYSEEQLKDIEKAAARIPV